MKKLLMAAAFAGASLFNVAALADDYQFDTEGQHAFIQFKIGHLGFSYIVGQFNQFDGSFSYDESNPAASKVSVTIDTSSVDTNHAERDKHLRSADFLEVDKYPEATFVSKSVKPMGDGKAQIVGDFTFHGVTKEVVIDATHVGGGKDPWGGVRQGFEGTTKFALKDFGIPKDLGPASKEVEIYMSFEGVRQ
ncbi:YceI family protein [Hahella ganghwensis]|uniref:YceI family protein n=1 Tax=Hahella ganghwensis TaxID=286420 RepID=UPI0003706456|nr:YceI family protein [Hahella ganghwensis]